MIIVKEATFSTQLISLKLEIKMYENLISELSKFPDSKIKINNYSDKLTELKKEYLAYVDYYKAEIKAEEKECEIYNQGFTDALILAQVYNLEGTNFRYADDAYSRLIENINKICVSYGYQGNLSQQYVTKVASKYLKNGYDYEVEYELVYFDTKTK